MDLTGDGHADILITEGDPSVDILMAAQSDNHRMVLKRGIPVRRAAEMAKDGIPFGMAAF